MIEIFGAIFFVGHLGHTTEPELPATSPSDFTADQQSTWFRMYQRDKYARDRVMKSARLLLPYLKSGDTLLDVGCFTQEAKKYYPRDIKYIGIDETKFHKETIVTQLNHGFQPIPSRHALCLETLEHLLDPKDTLDSISQSLPEDGLLVVSLPNEATLFHRIRCLFGVVDAGCFSASGKHIHLPSLAQARRFLGESGWDIHLESYYISPSACNSSSQWVGRILSLIPDYIHQFLADRVPSLFARGFIFLLKKHGQPDPIPVDPNYRSTFVRPDKVSVQ